MSQLEDGLRAKINDKVGDCLGEIRRGMENGYPNRYNPIGRAFDWRMDGMDLDVSIVIRIRDRPDGSPTMDMDQEKDGSVDAGGTSVAADQEDDVLQGDAAERKDGGAEDGDDVRVDA